MITNKNKTMQMSAHTAKKWNKSLLHELKAKGNVIVFTQRAMSRKQSQLPPQALQKKSIVQTQSSYSRFKL